MNLKPLLVLLVPLLIMSACIDDDDWYTMNFPTIDPDNSRGLFITNEGNYNYDNASLSYYNIDTKAVYNLVFFRSNDVPLGDVAHSMIVKDSLAYIVLNGSGKIYAINKNTFQHAGTITGLTSPRYMHFINDSTAYVTDLYARSIAIVNPKTFSIIGSIPVRNNASKFYQHPTEQMVQYKNYVFTNCWSYDNKILLIDSDKHQVMDSIEVIKQPLAMVMDKHDKLWVLSDGGFEGNAYGHEAPGLQRIDASTLSIERTWRFNLNDAPQDLCINGTRDTLFFINKDVFYHPISSDEEPKVMISSSAKNTNYGGYYSLNIDPINSDLYVADAIDHIQQGLVYRFSANGSPIDTFKVGVTPGSFCFKK